MSEFTTVPLFGGAITVSLPADFTDVSSIRQVSDNQEVYLSRTGFTSVIFDITERVEEVEGDEAALGYHFRDIVDEADQAAGRVKVWETCPVEGTNFPESTPVYRLVATIQQQPAAPKAADDDTPAQQQQPTTTTTAILLILVRLIPQKTDILITINIPHLLLLPLPNHNDNDGGGGGGGTVPTNPLLLQKDSTPQPLVDALQIQNHILQTFHIRDWSLFGPG